MHSTIGEVPRLEYEHNPIWVIDVTGLGRGVYIVGTGGQTQSIPFVISP